LPVEPHALHVRPGIAKAPVTLLHVNVAGAPEKPGWHEPSHVKADAKASTPFAGALGRFDAHDEHAMGEPEKTPVVAAHARVTGAP